MGKLLIESTKTTPFVCLDLNEEKFEIRGRSIPLNASNFYGDVMDWLKDNLNSSVDVELIFEMDYFNTSTRKYILLIINHVVRLNEENTIKWLYEDEDEEMREVGVKMQILSKGKFEFIAL